MTYFKKISLRKKLKFNDEKNSVETMCININKSHTFQNWPCQLFFTKESRTFKKFIFLVKKKCLSSTLKNRFKKKLNFFKYLYVPEHGSP